MGTKADRMLIEPAQLASYEADDLVLRLVAMFSEDAPKLAGSIAGATDAETRRRAAHALRGCALNLGAHELAVACAAIEANPSMPADVGELVAATIRALDRHCSAMQRAPV